MKGHKTEAVILDTTDIFDADRSFLLFTREMGKLRARARGVRKTTSKLTGHLLAYLPTQLELLESNSGLLITQAQVVMAEHSPYPENALLFMQQAELIAEALNRLFVEQDAHPVIYDGLVYILERLRALVDQDKVEVAQLLVAEFLFKCLTELGYQAELGRCVVSGEAVTEEFVGWSSQMGGILSKAGYEQMRAISRPIAARTVIVLRQFALPQFTAERITVNEEIREEACSLVYDYLQTQIGQPLRSLGVKNSLS